MTTGTLPSVSLAAVPVFVNVSVSSSQLAVRENAGQFGCHGAQKGRMGGGGTGHPLRDRTNFPKAASEPYLTEYSSLGMHDGITVTHRHRAVGRSSVAGCSRNTTW